MGSTHLEALRRVPGVEVVGIASRHRDHAEALGAPFGIDRLTDQWEELVADDEVDVVHNCTPNHLHYEINRACIEAGKHVVSEKPLTTTSREGRELVRLARERQVVTAVNFNYRFYPLVQQARQMASAGELGDIHLVHGQYLQDWLLFETDYNWRVDASEGGASRALADIGAHWCDLMQFITSSRITRIFADLFTIHETRKKPATASETFKQSAGEGESAREGEGTAGVAGAASSDAAVEDVDVDSEDGGFLLLEFANGARGALTVSQVSAGRKNRQWFEVDGSRGSLSWNQERPNELWIGRRDEPNQTLIKDPALLGKEAARYAHYPGGHPEGYPDGPKNLFANVYAHIRSRGSSATAGDARGAEGGVASEQGGTGAEPHGAPSAERNFPTFGDGLAQVRLVEAALESDASGEWISVLQEDDS